MTATRTHTRGAVEPAAKPGWTTTEFWVSLGALVTAVVAVVDPSHVLAPIASAAVAFGGLVTVNVYTWSRTRVKTAGGR